MEQSLYALHKSMESSWWYRGRSKAVLAAVKHASRTKDIQASKALDFGAGYGGMITTCLALAKTADAFEPNQEARTFTVTRGYHTVFSNEHSALEGSYGYFCLFDVLEHIEDDQDFLVRAKAAIDTSGHLVLTVPAFMFLWSEHDVANHHFRRYTKSSLCKLLRENGYEINYASYWNCSLLIPAGLMRLLGKSGQEGLTPPGFINAVLLAIVSVEAWILRYISLPFGLSVVVVASVRK